MPNHSNLCEYRYALPADNLVELARAVKDTLEDLAYAQVGQWLPYEVRLTIPLHLAGTQAGAAQRRLATWLSARGYAWLMLGATGVNAHLTVRCRKGLL